MYKYVRRFKENYKSCRGLCVAVGIIVIISVIASEETVNIVKNI